MLKELKYIRVLCLLVAMLATASLSAEEGPPGKNLRVYHIGNSLTRNVPLERLQQLFGSVGGKYEYGMQLGGGLRLSQHLVKRNHAGPPGSGKYNTVDPYGEYDNALQQFEFDALILQPYLEPLDADFQTFEKWPFFKAGSLQSAGAFIRYALGQTEPGKDRWDREHANTDHVATRAFYIYATWPKAQAILERSGEKTYRAYWDASYHGGAQPCREYFHKLVKRLNEEFPDLDTPVRMIPAGEVLAELDRKIRRGELPGIEEFFQRNQPYYLKARGSKAPFNPQSFQRDAGVLNFYADGVHMNDQPHNGKDSGTIGSYCAALTIYATLSGNNPVGLTVEPYEMFDPEADAALIRALQETVWQVVAGHPLTGVPGPNAKVSQKAEDGIGLPDAAEAPAVRKLIDRFKNVEEIKRDRNGRLEKISLRGLPELENASFRIVFDPESGHVVEVGGNRAAFRNDEWTLLVPFRELRVVNLHHNFGVEDKGQRAELYDAGGLTVLKDNRKIETINLPGSPFGADGLAAIAQLPQVKHLGIWHVNVEDADFAVLRGHPGLESIRFAPMWSPTITDKSFEHLSHCPNLKRISYNEGYVTWENGLSHLKRLKGTFEELRLEKSVVAPEDLDRFRREFPHVKVEHAGLRQVGELIRDNFKGAARKLPRWVPQELIEKYRSAANQGQSDNSTPAVPVAAATRLY